MSLDAAGGCTLLVGHGKHIGIGSPTISLYPRIVVHQSAISKLVDIQVGHLSLVL